MKDLFVAYSRYNRQANAAIFSVLEGLSAEQLAFPVKAYYPTVTDTVFHVLKSDVKWLYRLSSFSPSSVPKDVLDPYLKDGAVDPALVAAGLRDFVAIRKRVDEAVIAVIAAVPAASFLKNLEIEFGPKTMERPLWQLLMQWFNHQTHHRGQVSVQLDALGIDNDYSGVLDKIG